jgi:hypothetical protein
MLESPVAIDDTISGHHPVCRPVRAAELTGT